MSLFTRQQWGPIECRLLKLASGSTEHDRKGEWISRDEWGLSHKVAKMNKAVSTPFSLKSHRMHKRQQNVHHYYRIISFITSFSYKIRNCFKAHLLSSFLPVGFGCSFVVWGQCFTKIFQTVFQNCYSTCNRMGYP